MRLSICKEFTFAAAHKLPNYIGQCYNLHGHEWKLEVEISGVVDEKTGMVMDFAELKSRVKRCLIKDLDHQYLNYLIENPTAENLVMHIVKELNTQVELDIRLERIRLYETPTSFCEWRRNENL